MPAMLEDLAGLAAAQERHARALALAGAASALREALGAPRSSAEQEQIERLLASSGAALGVHVAAECWAEGQAMTLDQALTFALTDGEADTEQAQPSWLHDPEG